jgi:hypothetical protein
LQKCLCR